MTISYITHATFAARYELGMITSLLMWEWSCGAWGGTHVRAEKKRV
jgi:hypothetical protein